MQEMKKLKEAIIEKGVTQGEVASKLGVSRETLNAKLNGRQDFKRLEIEKLVEAFNFDPNIFFDY